MSQTEGSHGLTYDASEPEQLSLAVVDAVADAEGVEATDLAPLYYTIDPAALDALVRPPVTVDGEPTGEVRFSYHGYDVTVRSDGTVELD